MAEPIAVLEAHGANAQRAVFTPDGETLVTCGRDGRIRLWKVPSFAPDGAFEYVKALASALPAEAIATGEPVISIDTARRVARTPRRAGLRRWPVKSVRWRRLTLQPGRRWPKKDFFAPPWPSIPTAGTGWTAWRPRFSF